MLLVGGSIAFASQTLERGAHPTQSDPGPPPPPPLTVLAPELSVTRADSVDLTAVAPAGLRADQRYTVRIFVNDRPIGRIDLPGEAQFALKNVPLDEGVNSITTTLVGSGGESVHSAATAITRDDAAPQINVVAPKDKVYTESETLVGKTEPGADVHITDSAGREIESSINSDGRFAADVDLRVGDNELTIQSTDVAGNHSTLRYTIVRASSAASISLTAAPSDIFAADLPVTVELAVDVRDEVGRPVADGTQVVFGVSPPDRETTTYTATTRDGRARFSGVNLEAGDATGSWLATAAVTLPSGIELRADASFNLRAGAPKSPGPH